MSNGTEKLDQYMICNEKMYITGNACVQDLDGGITTGWLITRITGYMQDGIPLLEMP